MRLARARSRRSLQFEKLEDRLALSANIGTLEPAVAPLAYAARPTGYATPQGLTPADVRSIYEFDDVDFGGIIGDGTGQTIAIITAFHNPKIVSDLATFNQTFALPPPPSFTIVNQNGGTKLPKANKGWGSETALDVEWAHAIAPGANILLVEAKNASSLGVAIDYARHVPGVSVISVSASGKEFKNEREADPLFTTPPGHQGITFVFASGDDGGKAEYPSSSPYVLSVGGTTLYNSGNQYYGEGVWSGGGGGVSKYEGVPSYQNGLGLTARGTPDVTYIADPYTGFAVFDTFGSGGWAQFGGTSAGTPQWAALVAIANQGRALAGKPALANAQAALYSLPRSDFHDIIYGSNGNWATSGYDLASGLGSPIANLVVADLVAYNGSTYFTVATIPIATPKKPHKHLATPSMAYAVAGITYESIAINPNVDSRNVASMISSDTLFDAPRQRGPWETPDQRVLAPTMTAANDSISKKDHSTFEHRSKRRDEQLALSPILGGLLADGVDTVFVRLASPLRSGCT